LRFTNKIPQFKKKLFSCAALSAFIWITICGFNKLAMPSLSWLSTDSRLEYYLEKTFCTLWVVPLVVTSKIVCALWFMEAAESVFNASGRTKKAPGQKLADGIADLLFSLIIYVVFMLQASLAKNIPLEGLNSFLYFLHLSLLHGWTAFEYKWYPMGYDIKKRIHLIETRWAYFFGFGCPLALTATSFEAITSGCLFSVLFPMSILASHLATVPQDTPTAKFRIFGPTVYVADVFSAFIFSRIIRRNSKKTKNSKVQNLTSSNETPLSTNSSKTMPRPRKLY